MSNREIDNIELRRLILEIYSKSDKRFGANKIALILASKYCKKVSIARVLRLMNTMNLPKMSTVKPPKLKKIAEDENAVFNNILQQNFDQKAPNLVWVCDFTYIKVLNKHYYLCVILDLFSRKVVAYKVSNKIDAKLAIDTLEIAFSERKPASGLIFHTDRGSQFTSKDFRQKCDDLGITMSFSKKGHPYDNAVMECFFKYLKKEEVHRRNFTSLEQLNLSLFSYIYGFYNNFRPHSHNNGLCPNDFEDNFFNFTCPLY